MVMGSTWPRAYRVLDRCCSGVVLPEAMFLHHLLQDSVHAF